MKTIDFNRKFKDFRGNDVGDGTMAVEISKALFEAGVPELPINKEEKFLAYKLSTQLIANHGVIEVSEADAAFLSNYCMMAFSAGGFGQIAAVLND